MNLLRLHIKLLSVIAAALSVAMTVTSCSHDSGLTDDTDDGTTVTPQLISFGMPRIAQQTDDNNESKTRGLEHTDLRLRDDGYHIGVYAAYTGNTKFSDFTQPVVGNYFSNLEFVPIDASDANTYWKGATSVYWVPSDGISGHHQYLSFFSYAPYDKQNKQVSVPTGYTSGPLKLDFRPSSSIPEQIDLCVAKPAIDKEYDPDNDIKLEYKHTLTDVRFFARYTGDLPSSSWFVKIDAIKLENVIGHKTLTFDTTDDADKVYSWTDDAAAVSTDYASYSILRTKLDMLGPKIVLLKKGTTDHSSNPSDEVYDGVDKDLNNNLIYDFVQLQHINGVIYMLPQAITNQKITISYGLYSGKDGTDAQRMMMYEKTMQLPTAQSWTAGHMMHYMITIDIGNSSEISIVGEDYDGAVTAIHDWEPAGNTDIETNYK